MNKTPFLSSNAAGPDAVSPTSHDAQQQHLLKRHSSPGSFSTLRTRGQHAMPVDRPLLSHPSVIPGPSYPFPSQAPLARPHGFLHSLLKPFKRAHLRVQSFTFLDWLQLFLPCVRWMRTYRIREFLLWDIIAGISVGFMVVPQGMSYANIAGVPSVYGLYGAFLPVLVYAVFGSSKELAVGPVAVTSLLISSSLKEVVPGSSDITNPNNPPAELVPVQDLYNHRAIQLSLLVACMYTAVGVFNLGFLTNFLSHSVIGGFTSGAAIIIGVSQLKYILGYNIPRADKLYEQIHLYIEGIQGFVWQEYVMGVSLLTMLLTIKYFGKRYPRLKWLRPLGPISACIVAIIAVVAGNLQDKGIKIVGQIPAGLPSPTVGWWLDMDDAASLAPLALVVMVVDLLESTSIARALAAKGKYELNANQEIVGLGLANFAGSAFNAYSTTGSFSRSAVNYDSGCKTGLSGFVTGCVVGLVLLVMTPVFEKLPLNVMGAIVISGVSGLFEYEEAVHLFKVRKLDWCVWMCSFLSTMFLGVEIGLAISIGLALGIVIYESAFPHTALLGRVGRTTIYRNVKQFPDSQVIPGIAACRVDAAMYFANVQYIRERIRKYVTRAEAYSTAAGVPLQYVLLDMSPVTHLDSTGAALLETLFEELQQQGIQLGLCNPACAVVALLERTGFPDLLGREWIFVRMHDAVQTCLAAMLSDGQAVRPLSAYDSQAISPKAAAGGPQLFPAPGRQSPVAPARRSAPGGPRGDPLHSGYPGGRRSFDDGGSSPLLPQGFVGVQQAVGLRSGLTAHVFSNGLASLGLPGGRAARANGGAAAASGMLGAAGGHVERSSHGGEGSQGRHAPAPGFSSAGGADPALRGFGSFQGSSSEQQPAHLQAPSLQQQLGQAHLQQQQQCGQQPGLWAASAVATTYSAAGAAAGVGQAAVGMRPSSAVADDAGLASALSAAHPPLPLLRTSSHTRSADGSTSLSRVSSGALPPPVTLSGLHLHISPVVLNHPAVLSRTQSSAGGHECGVSAPLSTSSSFRRPVSPRTERLLDEVFSASNGDEEFLAGGSSLGHTGAMLQLTELGSDDHGGGLVGPEGDATAAGHGGTIDAAAGPAGEVRLLLGGPPGSPLDGAT